MAATTNYSLPLFEANSAINLVAVYNEAVKTIDAKLKEALTKSVFEKNDTDSILTVANIAEAKISKDGIIYYVAG